MRPTWAEIDLEAVTHNVGTLIDHVAPAGVCAVIKADGYGHGAVPVARAALDAGAEMLAVAIVDEGIRLREAGIRAPIMLLGEPRPSEMVQVADQRLEPAVYSGEGVAAAAAAISHSTSSGPMRVHLKVDTGMSRVGARPCDAVEIATAIAERPEIELGSVWSHCAVADDPTHPHTKLQFERYAKVLAALAAAGVEVPMRHIGNSAVALAHPEGWHDLVRCGIAAYGIEPESGLTDVELRPALKLVSEVSFVKSVTAGTAVSYGLTWTAERDTVVATVPIGYADGVRRDSGRLGVEVLVGGERRPVIGNVTMDQLLVDCGPDSEVGAGDEVVLVGDQGGETITANEIAGRLGTIGYEVVCGIGPRVRRRYV